MSQSSPTPNANPAATWNQRYAGDGYHFGTEPNAWLARHAGVWHAGERVLCVADGEGRNSVWLAQRGLQVQAFDIAEVGLQKARRLAQERGVAVDFVLADVDAYTWPDAPDAGQPDLRFDGVAAIFVQFAHPELRARMFDRIVRALRPDGRLVLQGYTPRQLQYRTGGPPQLEHLYTEAMLREAFAALQIDVLEDYEAEVDEGAGHRGRSALIGLVARKR
jgi:SAM-dependent methyltransferase